LNISYGEVSSNLTNLKVTFTFSSTDTGIVLLCLKSASSRSKYLYDNIIFTAKRLVFLHFYNLRRSIDSLYDKHHGSFPLKHFNNCNTPKCSSARLECEMLYSLAFVFRTFPTMNFEISYVNTADRTILGISRYYRKLSVALEYFTRVSGYLSFCHFFSTIFVSQFRGYDWGSTPAPSYDTCGRQFFRI
jgi:hypothetical protein